MAVPSHFPVQCLWVSLWVQKVAGLIYGGFGVIACNLIAAASTCAWVTICLLPCFKVGAVVAHLLLLLTHCRLPVAHRGLNTQEVCGCYGQRR